MAEKKNIHSSWLFGRWSIEKLVFLRITPLESLLRFTGEYSAEECVEKRANFYFFHELKVFCRAVPTFILFLFINVRF